MRIETIFENFELLTDAPNAVTKLREVILQLAVQGKLVRQNLNDEPASVLLELILAEKNQLLKKGKNSKSKLSNSGANDAFFELPQTWIWAKLDDITSVITDGEHATPPRTVEPEIPLGTAKNIRDGFLDLTNTDYVTSEVAKKCWKRCQPTHNDILMVCVGATTGRLCLLKEVPDFVIVRSVALIRPLEKYIHSEYIALAIKSPLIQGQIWGNVKQSAQPCLYINRMKILQIPLPPIAEQKRIVAKVDRLMSLCDTLEAKLKEARSRSEMLMEVAAQQILVF